MVKKKEQSTQDQDVTKEKKQRLSSDLTMLEKLVAKLGKKPMTKEELAGEMGLENSKSLNDSVFLSAIKHTGTSDFLKNLVEKKAGKPKKNPQYVKGRGLQITPWQFEGQNIPDKQRYRVDIDKESRVITLHPTEEENVMDSSE